MRIWVERVEQVLKEKEIIWKATNEDLFKRVELLSKKKSEKEEELAEVIVEVKASAALAVLKAKMNLDEDVGIVGS